MDDDDLYRAPDQVSWAIAAGTAPLPFLGFYAVIFLVHGLLYPVSPPDITGSRAGEAVAGFIALALFVFGCVSLVWFGNRTRRWPFLLGQFAVLVTAVDFVLDDTKGGRGVALLLVLTSAVSLGLALHPASWAHMRREVPFRRRGLRPQPAPQARPDDAPSRSFDPLADAPLTGDPLDPATAVLPSAAGAGTDGTVDAGNSAPTGGRYIGRRRARS